MSSNRRRGHNFERHVAKLFRRWFSEAKRGYQYRGSDKDCDVVGTPFYIEVKYAKRRFNYSLYSTWVKALRRRNQQRISGTILIIRRLAYKPITVSMSFSVADSLEIPSKDNGSGLGFCTWDVFSGAMDKKYRVRDESASD